MLIALSAQALPDLTERGSIRTSKFCSRPYGKRIVKGANAAKVRCLASVHAFPLL